MDPVVMTIRRLGFVGNSHYCPDCMNRFHEDRGQHKLDCEILAGLMEDEEWWDEAPYGLAPAEGPR